MFIPGSRVLIFQYSYRNSYTNNQYLAAQRPLANTSETSRGPYNHRAATSSCDSACKHCILGSHNSPTTGMLLTGETTSSQHGRTRCTQKKSWNCKEDTSADSPGYLLPCTYCRNWSEGSDMSQCDAVHEDSPCCCRPHLLKQTAALRTHTHTHNPSAGAQESIEQTCVQWNVLPWWRCSMSMLSNLVTATHMWLLNAWNAASATDGWIFYFM